MATLEPREWISLINQQNDFVNRCVREPRCGCFVMISGYFLSRTDFTDSKSDVTSDFLLDFYIFNRTENSPVFNQSGHRIHFSLLPYHAGMFN